MNRRVRTNEHKLNHNHQASTDRYRLITSISLYAPIAATVYRCARARECAHHDGAQKQQKVQLKRDVGRQQFQIPLQLRTD